MVSGCVLWYLVVQFFGHKLVKNDGHEYYMCTCTQLMMEHKLHNHDWCTGTARIDNYLHRLSSSSRPVVVVVIFLSTK